MMNARYLTYSMVLAIGLAGGWAMTAMSFQIASNSDPSEINADDSGSTGSPLQTLDWLVGSWIADAGANRVEFDCRFTKNNAFLMRSFRVSENAVVKMSGMQIVGWDPQRNTIRSWTFDSDGGFGEEFWSQADDRYTVRSKFTLADGGAGAALNALTFIDQDTFGWKSANREIDGELLPDSEAIVFSRVASDAPQPNLSVPGESKP